MGKGRLLRFFNCMKCGNEDMILMSEKGQGRADEVSTAEGSCRVPDVCQTSLQPKTIDPETRLSLCRGELDTYPTEAAAASSAPAATARRPQGPPSSTSFRETAAAGAAAGAAADGDAARAELFKGARVPQGESRPGMRSAADIRAAYGRPQPQR